jgi:hypothetical protein
VFPVPSLNSLFPLSTSEFNFVRLLNKYLFVNLTDKKNNSEGVCVLAPDPSLPSFINKESVIAYYFAREMDANDLAICITSGSPIPKDCLSADIVSQIQQGGLISKKLKNKYKTALKNFLGID